MRLPNAPSRPERAGFRMILKAEPGIEVVGEAEDGRAAVDAARELRPDVVLAYEAGLVSPGSP